MLVNYFNQHIIQHRHIAGMIIFFVYVPLYAVHDYNCVCIMPKKKSSMKEFSDVDDSPSVAKREVCTKTPPRTTSQPSHPMRGKCTVDSDVDHFSMGYAKVNCTACATLPHSTYRDYSSEEEEEG